jgi:hypothetical protein
MMKNSTPMVIIGPRFVRAGGAVIVVAMVLLSPECDGVAGRMTGTTECPFIRRKVQRCQFPIMPELPDDRFCAWQDSHAKPLLRHCRMP